MKPHKLTQNVQSTMKSPIQTEHPGHRWPFNLETEAVKNATEFLREKMLASRR